ncbi:hypothetical protein ADIS_4816 [Lunatimonas lonarensis]|uniref:TolB protein n=1 Tax=Lunatimonas lonarensis TaxID=1232681 RepID=R7ZKT6_9BACT|nr:hypothetical protein [Lunatimonas lonarensis]EON74705.1 hypothetical protein ADIS_4816 [Lunatimonas lonarensis]
MKNQTNIRSKQVEGSSKSTTKKGDSTKMPLRGYLASKKGVLVLAVAALLTLPSCEDETASPAPPVTNPPEATGNILVKVTTVGGDDDPDGYTITVQGIAPVEVDPNGETSFSSQRVGRYQVELSGIASHCAGTGNMVREVNVTANGTATVEFEVGCRAILRDRIVYAKGRDQNFSDWKIYSSKLDGTDERVIFDQVISVSSTTRISPDGTKLAFSDREGETFIQRVYVMDVDGENLKTVPFIPNDNPNLTSQFGPVWHPDGKKVSFRNGVKLVTYDLEAEERTEIDFTNEDIFIANDVTDDGKRFLGIRAINRPGETASQALVTMNIDGSDIQTVNEGALFINPRLGKDNTVYYLKRLSSRNDQDEIWQVNLDGTGDVKISDRMGLTPGMILRSFTLSPDRSEFLIYTAIGFDYPLVRTRIDGPAQTIVFPEAGLRVNPVWSPVTRE